MTMTLKQWIEAKQLTQRMAAKRLGVDAPTMCRWLGGRFKPSLKRAYRIEKVTDGAVPMWTWVAKKPPHAAPESETFQAKPSPNS